MAEKIYVPVYLPDRTIIGTAQVDVEAGTATIKLEADSSLAELIQESLVGISIIYMDRNAVEVLENKENN